MSTDPAQQAQLRRQIAQEMKDSLPIDAPVQLVQDALENSLDMHNAEIMEKQCECVHGDSDPNCKGIGHPGRKPVDADPHHHHGRKAD